MNIPNSISDAGSVFIQWLAFLQLAIGSTSHKYQGKERLASGQIAGSSLEKKGPRSEMLLQKNYYFFTKIGTAARDKWTPKYPSGWWLKHVRVKGVTNTMALTENILKKALLGKFNSNLPVPFPNNFQYVILHPDLPVWWPAVGNGYSNLLKKMVVLGLNNNGNSHTLTNNYPFDLRALLLLQDPASKLSNQHKKKVNDN